MLRNNLNSIIFSLLFTAAAGYTLLVYTIGTANKNAGHLSANAAKGKLLYQEYNCQACHQIYGLGGYMGPDLTNVISAKGILYAKALISTGTARMPDFHLKEEQIDQLTEYLRYIDQSGRSPIYKPLATTWGNFIIPPQKH